MNAIVVVPVQPARPAPRPGAQRDRARPPDADHQRKRPREERKTPPPQPIPEILPADTLDDLSPSATVGHIVDTFALPAGSFGGSPMHGRTRCW